MSHAFNAFWDAWSAGMLRACWVGAIAVGVGWIICLPPRLPAALKCWVWRAVYLKLILALVWIPPLRLPVWRAVPRDLSLEQKNSADVEFPKVLATHGIPPVAARTVAVVGRRATADWRPICLGIWLAGVLGCGIRVGQRWVATVRDRRGCQPVHDPSILALYAGVAKLCRIARPPPLITCAGIGPRLLGLFRPAIVIPEELLESGRHQLELLLAHELAHYNRHDLWWAWLALCGRVLLWFHPAVWFAERQWKLREEIACDHAALAALSAPAGDYARMLLDVASQFRPRARSPLAVGVVESAITLERRLIAMRRITTWSPTRRVSVGLVLAAIAAVAIVPWRLVAQQPQDEQARSQPHPAATEGPSSRPAIHPPLHTREEINRRAADHNSVHGMWLFDNIAQGLIECPFADVSAGAAGTLSLVKCAEGQQVKKGDLLFALDDARARAACAEAEAEYKKADVNYQKLASLEKSHAVSSSDVEIAQADRQIAAARLQIAQKDLNDTRIIAPMTGVVTRLSSVAGNVVNRGALLAQILDVEKPTVRFDTDSAQFPYLRVGQKVRVLHGHTAEESVPATITFVSPTVDGPSGTLRARATLDAPDPALKPGMVVRVDLQLYKEEELAH